MHVDRHVVKMPLETAQLLCTAQSLNGIQSAYKTTHINHPCSIWARESVQNYAWLCLFGLELCVEYTYRYGKVHACERIITDCYNNMPLLPNTHRTPFAQAMPDECKVVGDAVQAYRNYYLLHKQHLYNWTRREIPFFVKNNTDNYQKTATFIHESTQEAKNFPPSEMGFADFLQKKL